ncbi:MAG: YicC family protein [Bacteroidales bacterium]|nr:YicC family protein [Bacteroidales bacterium]
MILSMTGYGKSESQMENTKIVVELRGLNSKSLDLSTRLAPQLRNKELEIRTIINQRLERGKVDLSIQLESVRITAGDPVGASPVDVCAPGMAFTPINKEAFDYYYKELRSLQSELGMAEEGLTSAILRMPDVMRVQEESSVSEGLWEAVKQTLMSAIDHFIAFRTQEGASLERMFTEKLDGIAALLAEVEPYEKSRVEKIRTHLLGNLEKLGEDTKQKIDMNRLEQEMIYYLEKLDINEEKVRLRNHIQYFRETMQGNGSGVGKKLGFIAQEMGREINTLGSKSNQSEMQIIVVKMKDILEQIKEQVLNVL